MITDTSTSSQLSELPDSGSSKVIYIRPKFRYVFIMSFFPMVIYCSVFAVLLYLPSVFNWAFIPLVVVLATSFLFIVWTLLRVITTSWTLSADQLCFMRGVIARRTDYLELYRVTDYIVRESVPERMLGLCSFYLISTDTSSPVMQIFGIPNIKGLQNEIRLRVEQQRQEKRIYEIGNN